MLVLRGLRSLGGGARTAKNEEGQTNGAQGRNRTTDTVIFSHGLYQLSYLGADRETKVRTAPGVIKAR